MSRYGKATWKPLPENKTQPKIKPTQIIFHSMVGYLGGTDSHFRNSTGSEAHIGISDGRDSTDDGEMWQWMDFDVRADANYKANRRPDGTGAISIELADGGKPSNPLTKAQVAELVDLTKFLMDKYAIPYRWCRNESDPGLGWHAMWGAPSQWTNVKGKTCPGAVRIKQLQDEVFPLLSPEGPLVPSKRIAGADRYGTAFEIMKTRFEEGVGGSLYLAAAGSDDAALAPVLGAPILLVGRGSTTLPTATRDAIRYFKPDEVNPLGGPNAVTNGVVTKARREAAKD